MTTYNICFLMQINRIPVNNVLWLKNKHLILSILSIDLTLLKNVRKLVGTCQKDEK